MEEKLLSVSIVLYENDLEEITNTINCALKSELINCIYLIDNSRSQDLKILVDLEKTRLQYFYQGVNLGFGKAHNIALEISKKNNFKYHLILNPDIKFEPSVIKILCDKLNSDITIGLIMPKILNEDGTNQFLPKLIPYPINLFIRIIKPLRHIFKNKNDKYILKNFENEEVNAPIISGCFCIYSINAFTDVGGYDEDFFMYYEDFDLSRRVHVNYKTLYFPLTSVVHGYERGATKSYRLFKIFVTSVFKYFNKHGWFYDCERRELNRKVVDKLYK